MAGTLFEAAPFVLAASVLSRARFGRHAATLIRLAGCGCRNGPLPGALALPAIALCTLAFGWPIALARTLAGLALAALVAHARNRSDRVGLANRVHSIRTMHAESQPFDELAALVPATLAAVLVRDLVTQGVAHLGSSWGVSAGEVALGALMGWLMPCATAAVAVAAAFHGNAPAIAIGILATCGLLPTIRRHDRTPDAHVRAASEARLAFAIAGAALALVASGAAPGFVSPRFQIALAVGSALALVCVVRPPPGVRPRGLVSLALCGAIVCGSPAPITMADATTPEDAYPGETLAFTGHVDRRDGRTLLERSTITCCRIDARTIAVELAITLPVTPGTWIEVAGTFVRASDGRLRLAPNSWHAIAPPRDPFAYR